MSMRSFFVQGFGFETDKITDAAILKFIVKHIDSCLDISDETDRTLIKTYSDDQINAIALEEPDFLSGYSSTDLYDIDRSLAEALEPLRQEHDNMLDTVTAIINKEADLNLSYQPAQSDEGCIGEACILLEYRLPWEYSKKECACKSCKDFAAVLKPYLEELGLDADKCLTDLEVEYYG